MSPKSTAKFAAEKKKTGIEVKRPLLTKQIAQLWDHFSSILIEESRKRQKKNNYRKSQKKNNYSPCSYQRVLYNPFFVCLVFVDCKKNKEKKGYFRGVAAIMRMEVHGLVSKNWDSENSSKERLFPTNVVGRRGHESFLLERR